MRLVICGMLRLRNIMGTFFSCPSLSSFCFHLVLFAPEPPSYLTIATYKFFQGSLLIYLMLECTRFKAAWCSEWEKLPVPEVFGEMDVVADSLEALADGIIEASR